ncbi:hypothetical protein V8F20_007023 [Naviculisporaceae sp. PSN 640]
MANLSEKQSQQGDKLSLVYDTALCLIPPTQFWPSIDRLRSLYDKAYEKWPPHVNLIYPFVRPEVLPAAAERIQAALSKPEQEWTIPVELDTADAFIRKNDNTLFRCDGDKSQCATLNRLRNEILKAIGHPAGNNFRMHMSVAQSEDADSASHKSLLSKVGLLPTVSWTVDKLHILVRERLHVNGKPSSQMNLWGTISLSDGSLSRLEEPRGFYGISAHPSDGDDDEISETGEKDQLRTTPGYYFNEELDLWVPYTTSDIDELDEEDIPSTLTISSYNVLAEFDWPPSETRHPLLLKTILSKEAAADVLVLQEVTDTFLSALLQDDLVRERYPYVSHGPPSQGDVEPLPSMLNIVVLSQFPFDWEFVSFHRKHKGSVVAKFRDLRKSSDAGGSNSLPLILATVHLSHGLTDGAVAAKKIEIQMLLRYLATTYPQNPLILAGDTNISTSAYSINAALQKKNISAVTVASLASFDQLFAEAGLSDAWTVSRSEMGDVSYFGYGQDDEAQEEESFDGEQGATYDPLKNEVAAEIVGSGFNNRPQRFDRILVRGGGFLEISRFNKFGFLKEKLLPDGEETYGSDHWGVRAVLKLKLTPEDNDTAASSQDTSSLVVPVHLKKAPSSLSDPSSVKECLANLGVLPTELEITKRKTALEILKQALQFDSSPNSVIVVPVGSYALGVWTSASDMDILCIGPFSSSTFFALATQRLKKASSRDIRILRRVKANTGLMLELQVHSIKMDLQYCPAGAVAQQFPRVLSLPASDPIWSLSPQTLSKLKALRDVDYLRRSIPDLTTFRTAHRFIKTWAKSRGIYTARFGFLGSIHISILLARVHKLLVLKTTSGPVSVPDLLTTFFDHYATFNWEKDLVFDPLFHKHRLQYTRTVREPLAILGYFPPALNTAHTASVPSVRTIAAEFNRAGELLSTSGGITSWGSFLAGDSTTTSANSLSDSGAQDFLASFKSFVKIDVQYWGLSPSRGAQFIGWLESRLVMLLVDMNRRAPGVYARMWPGRFIESSSSSSSPTTTSQPATGEEAEAKMERELSDYQALYLIGLDKAQESMTREELHLALGAIQTSLSRFETQIRGDEKYFDGKNCWMACSVVNKSEVASLQLRVDTKDLGVGEYTPGEEEEDDDDEDSDSDSPSNSGFHAFTEDEATTSPSQSKKSKKGSNKKKHTSHEDHDGRQGIPGAGEKKPKFRTAADVMNRLKWDPQIDSSEYIIGYEDRFLGARERPLSAWKTEQTDEEFIPLHRILYFKRKRPVTATAVAAAAATAVKTTSAVSDGGDAGTSSDAADEEGANVNAKGGKKMDSGEIVWERKTRKDLIFGSGVE